MKVEWEMNAFRRGTASDFDVSRGRFVAGRASSIRSVSCASGRAGRGGREAGSGDDVSPLSIGTSLDRYTVSSTCACPDIRAAGDLSTGYNDAVSTPGNHVRLQLERRSNDQNLLPCGAPIGQLDVPWMPRRPARSGEQKFALPCPRSSISAQLPLGPPRSGSLLLVCSMAQSLTNYDARARAPLLGDDASRPPPWSGESLTIRPPRRTLSRSSGGPGFEPLTLTAYETGKSVRRSHFKDDSSSRPDRACPAVKTSTRASGGHSKQLGERRIFERRFRQ